MKTNINLRAVARNSLRMYFAPLVGAYKAVVNEVRRSEREDTLRLKRQDRPTRTSKRA